MITVNDTTIKNSEMIINNNVIYNCIDPENNNLVISYMYLEYRSFDDITLIWPIFGQIISETTPEQDTDFAELLIRNSAQLNLRTSNIRNCPYIPAHFASSTQHLTSKYRDILKNDLPAYIVRKVSHYFPKNWQFGIITLPNTLGNNKSVIFGITYGEHSIMLKLNDSPCFVTGLIQLPYSEWSGTMSNSYIHDPVTEKNIWHSVTLMNNTDDLNNDIVTENITSLEGVTSLCSDECKVVVHSISNNIKFVNTRDLSLWVESEHFIIL